MGRAATLGAIWMHLRIAYPADSARPMRDLCYGGDNQDSPGRPLDTLKQQECFEKGWRDAIRQTAIASKQNWSRLRPVAVQPFSIG